MPSLAEGATRAGAAPTDGQLAGGVVETRGNALSMIHPKSIDNANVP